jgi:AcrR family transcriptional regulator
MNAMARPKEFERETALQEAIEVFSHHGYEGTSTDALLQAMGINRQSMYDTFGDKWRLYLEALQRYTADSVGEHLRALDKAPSALQGLHALVHRMVDQAVADPSPACLGVSAICEFGRSDPEVTIVTEMAGRMVRSALERRIVEAKAVGDVPRDVDVTEAASFIQAALVGIKMAARSGASAENLRGIARMVLRCLR